MLPCSDTALANVSMATTALDKVTMATTALVEVTMATTALDEVALAKTALSWLSNSLELSLLGYLFTKMTNLSIWNNSC